MIDFTCYERTDTAVSPDTVDQKQLHLKGT